ncbi:hypothetical protein KS08_04690 [Bacillus subtilis]|nr:hypothetical protein BAMTA208_04565 [Bacillus amyloliquefaciens TA208]AIW32964.1 hypothetical protein KS08_04690 [Bacillus subtilis]ASF28220.1 hypothetical protein WV34_05395 [Bacillus amyloliquefaciens]OXL22560.1 hypothetical protein CFI04_03985 [Bacillus amyloliquefaciens]RHX70580.1 hypothetical protein D0A23_00610 [Bacillus amyloliquefaciens]
MYDLLYKLVWLGLLELHQLMVSGMKTIASSASPNAVCRFVLRIMVNQTASHSENGVVNSGRKRKAQPLSAELELSVIDVIKH